MATWVPNPPSEVRFLGIPRRRMKMEEYLVFWKDDARATRDSLEEAIEAATACVHASPGSGAVVVVQVVRTVTPVVTVDVKPVTP